MTIGPVIGGARGPPNLAVENRLAQRLAKHPGAPVACTDERGELAALGGAVLVQRALDGLDVIVEGLLGRERGCGRDAGGRGTARSGAVAAQASAFTLASAVEAGADAFLTRATLVGLHACAALVGLLAAGPVLALAVEVWSAGVGVGQWLGDVLELLALGLDAVELRRSRPAPLPRMKNAITTWFFW